MKKTIAIVLVFILAVLCLASCMPRGGVSSLAGQASSGKLSTGMTVLECLNTLAEDDQLRRTFYPYSLKMNSHPAVYAAELTDGSFLLFRYDPSFPTESYVDEDGNERIRLKDSDTGIEAPDGFVPENQAYYAFLLKSGKTEDVAKALVSTYSLKKTTEIIETTYSEDYLNMLENENQPAAAPTN